MIQTSNTGSPKSRSASMTSFSRSRTWDSFAAFPPNRIGSALRLEIITRTGRIVAIVSTYGISERVYQTRPLSESRLS